MPESTDDAAGDRPLSLRAFKARHPDEFALADAELSAQRRWLPQKGPWEFRVERLFFVVGLVIATSGVLLTLALTHAAWSLSDVVLVPLFAVPAAWALARWFGPSTYPTDHILPAFTTIVIWAILAALSWRLALLILPSGTVLGSVERWWLAPPLIAAVHVVGARFRLKGWVSFFAALVFVGGFVAGNDSLRDSSLVAATSSAVQLQAAERTGDTVVMRAADLGPPGRPAVQRSPAIGLVRAATTCGAGAGRDQRRTALGTTGRTMAFRAEVCWDAAGRPVQAVLDAVFDPGHQSGAFRPVRLNVVGPLDSYFADGLPIGAVPERPYEDTAKPGLSTAQRRTLSGTEIFRPNGRLASAQGTGDEDQNTTLLRVSRDGSVVAMAYAVESRDPLARFHGSSGGDGPSTTIGDDPSQSSTYRVFRVRTRNGFTTDVLTVTATYQGADRPVDVSASLVRSTAHGTTAEPIGSSVAAQTP